ncbi:MAG: hypothetical protein LUE24_08160 [Lachnospiraceae bacterium]|nr:hypothetical protein [Lachnospiraceae bacterium]
MREKYRSLDEALKALHTLRRSGVSSCDRVLKSTKLEDGIYAELRSGDNKLDELEADAGKKLRTFPSLSRDIFQSFYSLAPKRIPDAEVSPMAGKFNARILDCITQSEDYVTLKSACEGCELPSYEAASEFIAQTAANLDSLLANIGGNSGALNTLEKLENAERKASDKLTDLMKQRSRLQESNDTLEQAVLKAANAVCSKRRQVEAVSGMIDLSAAQNMDAISAAVSCAVNSAKDKADEVRCIICAWSDEPGNLEKSPENIGILEAVRSSAVLKDISKYLGRFRELLTQGRRNGYAYGRGEKYTLELGRDISRALTSELAMLASPQTLPLFLRKQQLGQIKQYRRREPIYKGRGDIICCLDESSSTTGDNAAWGKAVALTLMEIATGEKRSFALIHFSGRGFFQTDIFRSGEYTVGDKMRAAETFLNGGTNFESPLREALRLMEQEHFENADVVFITDGERVLPENFAEQFSEQRTAKRFTVTGVLLDSDCPNMEFSLKPFCQKIYRTSELLHDDIASSLITDRV